MEQQKSEQQEQVGCTMTTHLTEPGEAELELGQSVWPERGKLLQVAMDAGPLLQTLLLTDPLPDSVMSTWPKRGKFLQAVMEAGPLLQTLLLIVPLPDSVEILWRSPGYQPSNPQELANALDTLQLNSED